MHEAGNGDTQRIHKRLLRPVGQAASLPGLRCAGRRAFRGVTRVLPTRLPAFRTRLPAKAGQAGRLPYGGLSMLLGYNTNGFAHHRLDDTLEILAELGYQSVALTLDHHALNPFQPDLMMKLEQTRYLLDELKLACVIETGARFLLDPRRK